MNKHLNTYTLAIFCLFAVTVTCDSGSGGSGLSDAEAVQAAAEALEVEYAPGDDADSVTQDLGLTDEGENGTTVTWSAVYTQSGEDATAVVGLDGTVVRPSNGSGDAQITLIAAITKGDASTTVEFAITVLQALLADADIVALDKDLLEITFTGGDASNSVTSDVTLPATGNNGSEINWSSDTPATITASGAVTRPAYGTADVTVILTAQITSGGESDSVSFTVTVKAYATCQVTTIDDFTDNCNGTLTDNSSGLTWKKCAQGMTWDSGTNTCTGTRGTYQYCDTQDNSCNGGSNGGDLDGGGNSEAYDTCNGLNSTPAGGFASITSWRVPTKDEMKNIVICTNGPATPLADSVACNGGSAVPPLNELFLDIDSSPTTTWYYTATSFNAMSPWNMYLGDSITGTAGTGSVKDIALAVLCVSD